MMNVFYARIKLRNFPRHKVNISWKCRVYDVHWNVTYKFLSAFIMFYFSHEGYKKKFARIRVSYWGLEVQKKTNTTKIINPNTYPWFVLNPGLFLTVLHFHYNFLANYVAHRMKNISRLCIFIRIRRFPTDDPELWVPLDSFNIHDFDKNGKI